MTETRVTITGIAQNSYVGAQVETEHYGLVLVQGQSPWPANAVGRTITVEGKEVVKEWVMTYPPGGPPTEIEMMVLKGLAKWEAK